MQTTHPGVLRQTNTREHMVAVGSIRGTAYAYTCLRITIYVCICSYIDTCICFAVLHTFVIYLNLNSMA